MKLNAQALFFLATFSLLFPACDLKGQQQPGSRYARHHIKVYKSNDSITLQDFRSIAGVAKDGSHAIDAQAQARFIKRIVSASYAPFNGEKKQFTVTGTLTLNIASTGTTCGASNGSIDVAASGGTLPYTYSENGYPAQSSGYFYSLAPGTYNVTATDVNGASTTATVVLSNTYDMPTVELIGYTQLSSCNSSDGSITLVGSGGQPPYTYSVDGLAFQSSSTISNLPATYFLYYCFVKDAIGCIGTLTGGFSYSNPGSCLLYYEIGGDNTSCINEGSLMVYGVTGGTAPYQYSIDGINYQSSSTFSNLPSGLFKVYVKDATGYVQMKTALITQYCPITVTVTADSPPCGMNGGSFSIDAAYGTPPYQYSIDGVNFQSANIFSNLKAGRYTVTVKDMNGAVSTADAAIDNSCLAISSSTNNETCSQKNGSITIVANNGVQPYQYSIDGVNFQAGNVFSNLASGQYAITVKDAAGQTADTNAIVNSSCLDLVLSSINTTCGHNNGSITAAVSNGTAPYQYSIDGINFQSANLFPGLLAGSYTITVKDASGLLATAGISVTDVSGPLLSPVLSQASCNNTNGAISIVRYGGTDPVQYSIDGGIALQTDSIFNGLDSGQYIAYAKDANGCMATDTVHLTALPTPYVQLGNDTTLCNGNTLLLQAPQEPGYAYQWQDNSSAYTYLVTTAGNYSVKITNQYNCSATGTINVKFVPLPVFSLGNDTAVCTGKTFALQPSPLSSQGNFLWNDGSTNPALNISAAGLYWLQESDNGCTYRDSVTISYKPSPSVSLGNDTTLCNGQTVLLDAANNNSTYLWQDGSVTPQYVVSKSGTYSVKVDENGCDTMGIITVTYISKPVVSMVPDTTLCITQQLILDAVYPNSTYEWQDGSTNPQFLVAKEGSYTVQVTNNCGTTADTSIVSYENCACKFYVPNAFTPNSDGKNDVFVPKYQCLYSNYQLKVYNRWGQLVFASESPSGGWDGSLGGSPQPAGTYVWEMSYKDNLTGKLMRQNGTVLLIR